MRLTQLLFFKQKWPGNIYTGKKRCVKKVTFKDMVKLRDEYDRQVKVMTLLKHPYLTKEESSGHAVELGKQQKFIDRAHEYKRQMALKPPIKIEDRLVHLTVKDCWD